MLGAGTKAVTINADPPARVLDLTRLVSRVGKGAHTGVDRVELAYLKELLSRDCGLFGLLRTPLGFLLLDRAGAQGLADRITGKVAWGKPDLLGRIVRRGNHPRAGAEADARRLAIARCRPPKLATMLHAHVPVGASYLNVGHSNLSDVTLGGAKAAGLKVAVFVHDTIPLDFPQYSGAGIPKAFEEKMQATSDHADLVICNSQATQDDVHRHFRALGRVPDTVVALLGLDLPDADTADFPSHIPTDRPYFVAIGTIEPRKNHALLLDVWDRLRSEMPETAMPRLVIAGRRGWKNAALFARLDDTLGDVIEDGSLTDKQVFALLSRSHGLLFPTHAEGFGLPAAEAAMLGIPVFVSDLPVFREFLDDFAVYLKVSDEYPWVEAVKRGLEHKNKIQDTVQQGPPPFIPPTWGTHFDSILGKV